MSKTTNKATNINNSDFASGIIEGAKWIANNYYNSSYGQKTLNQMCNNNGVHQYNNKDSNWANEIANLMKSMPLNSSTQYINGPANSTNNSTNSINSSNTNTTTSTNNTSSQTTISASIDNSDIIKLKEYDRRNRAANAESLKASTAPVQLNQADISSLSLPPVEDDGSAWTDGSVNITEYRTMTTDEFNALAIAIATECEGETLACKMAMAQYIYDSIQLYYNGSGITAYIKNNNFSSDKTSQEAKDMNEAKNCVQRVFQAGARWKKDYKVFAFTSMSNSNFAVSNRNDKYTQIGTVNQHIFYGYKEPSYTIGYNIEGYGVSQASSNTVTVVRQYSVNAIDITDTAAFGKPIYIKSKVFDTHSPQVGRIWSDLNNDLNRINTSFVDDCQYSSKGRLVKAFPTFLFCILDDQAQWYDGRKLWTNFYVYKPVIDIQYHAANDMPTETAQITVTNTYHNLDRSSAALIKYSISEDEDYGGFNKWLYKNFGMIAGGLKITNRLIQMHSILFNHTKVREGARVHLRMGYGSDPMSLAPIINGTISGMTLGDQISITVTSDGHELIQSITSDKSKDLNNGALGLFGLGANQEASNIISEIMVKRQSWINHLFFGGNWFEGSKYNIEHYGLYINSGDQYVLQGGIDVGIYEQYDLLMNIYKASTSDGWFGVTYKHFGYMYLTECLLSVYRDGEANIVFNKYNMTPWDIFQLCAQTMPEFLVKSEKYQFDSRLYYGLPFDLTKYRYDIINGTIYQECKANTQMHYLDSLTGIIENQLSVTSKPSYTNAKVIYTRGKTPKATAVIHSDDTIDNSKQSTTIIDSAITQDYIGIDAFSEFIGIRHGKEAARRLGISNLLYGWQKQYQGQILCLGQPQIKPDDYLMINDFYTSLNGLALTREVIHSFSTATGFTTSIIPGIIGFCPEQESGNIELIASFLKLYSQFTEYSQSRKILKENCERYAKAVALVNKSVKNIHDYNAITKGWENASNIATVANNINTARLVYKMVRCAKNAGSIFKAAKEVGAVYKVLKDASKAVKFGKGVVSVVRAVQSINLVSKGVDAAKASILATGAATGTVTLGLGFAVSLLICLIIDIVLAAIESWIRNRNVCVLLPLWWEGKPFIAGVKDGEKILLINDENAGSEENTGEDGKETDKDELSVEDN